MSDTEARILEAATHIQSYSRRDFLRASSVAAGLLAAGVTGLTPHSAWAQVPEGITHMSPSEHAVYYRLMEVLFAKQGSTLLPPQSLPVLQTVDGAFLATMPGFVLEGLKGGVAYFDEAPKAAFGKPFTELSDADAIAFCDAMAGAQEIPARALFQGLKFLIVTAYWAIPPTWEPVGFDGPVSDKWGLDYLGNAPLPQA